MTHKCQIQDEDFLLNEPDIKIAYFFLGIINTTTFNHNVFLKS